jgi:hypothetical protein
MMTGKDPASHQYPTQQKAPANERGLLLGELTHADLVIAHAVVIATPPIGAPSDKGLSAQPPAVVIIGIVIGTVDPDPHAIAEYPMTMMEAVKVVAALREAAVLEPVAAIP